MGERSMKPRIDILLTLVVLAALSTAGSRAVHAQEIFAGGYAQQSGEDLYKAICQGCHMPDAKGAKGAGAYPALAGDAKLEAGGYPVLVVVRGQKAMPGYGYALSDEQVAAVVNYVRSHFGN